MPESAKAPTVGAIRLPQRESDDPAVLAAWYGPFGWAENLRKVCLASAREIVRAKAALTGEKLSEARIDDKARISPEYMSWLEKHLIGRTLYEQDVLRRGIGG